MLVRTSLSFLTIKQGIFEMFLTLELFCHPVTLIGFDKFTSENVRCNLITKTKYTSSSRWPNYVRFCPEVRCLFWLKSIQASFPCKSCHLWKRSLGAVHLVSTGRAGIRVWSVRVYTITWLLCAFSLVVDSDLFSFFMPQKSFNKPFEFLLDLDFYCHADRVVLFCPLHTVTSSVIYYSTHTRKM